MLAALLAALGLAGSAAAQGVSYPDHTILTNVNIITMGRIDPIINPGEVGGHVHTVLGASNFRCECLQQVEWWTAGEWIVGGSRTGRRSALHDA